MPAGRAQRRLEQGRHQLRCLAALARSVSRWTIFAPPAPRCWPRQDLADILQLGSPSGYEPLRRYLMEEARRQQVAGPGDDLLITNGCQQALDLIGRVLLRPGDTVAVEDPVYTGSEESADAEWARNSAEFRSGADGMDAGRLERVLERERPRFLVVTSNFQNPTGASLPMAARKALLDAARECGRAGDRKRRSTANCATAASRCPRSSNWTRAAGRCCCAVFPR